LDSFTFKVNDGQADSAAATIFLTITPVNDRPIAQAQNLSTPEDTPLEITLAGTDVDLDPLTYQIVTLPSKGTLNPEPSTRNQFIYTPATNYNGNDSFQFIASDGWLDSAPATISLIIKPVNDAPVADPQVVITPEDTATNLVLTASDVEGDSLSFTLLTAPSTARSTAPLRIWSFRPPPTSTVRTRLSSWPATGRPPPRPCISRLLSPP
jgi:hypothetical protein